MVRGGMACHRKKRSSDDECGLVRSLVSADIKIADKLLQSCTFLIGQS